MRQTPETLQEDRSRMRAAVISLMVGLALMLLKFWAFRLTGSQAVFSDAMESIVNVVAATLTIVVLLYAAKPADRDHPYGHGKVEFFSAAFEGGLIAFAAVLICVEALQALLRGPQLEELNLGIFTVLGAGLANLLLGIYLRYMGRKNRSVALIASGQHVMSDFWTSIGVAAGLVLVRFTGLVWIDPVVALIVGLLLAWTGVQLVRRSIGGLLDEEDRGLLENLVKVISVQRMPGIIQLHHCRVIRSGRYHHIDAHVVVPEYWDVAHAHEKTLQYEKSIIDKYPYDGELHFHMDPCRRAYCRYCEVENCPVRQQAFKERRVLSVDEIANPDEPEQFRDDEEPA